MGLKTCVPGFGPSMVWELILRKMHAGRRASFSWQMVLLGDPLYRPFRNRDSVTDRGWRILNPLDRQPPQNCSSSPVEGQKALVRASAKACPCIFPAKCTGLFPYIGSHPDGSAVQKNCVSSPTRPSASSTVRPTTLSAAFQVAPHGAPLITCTRATTPSRAST